MAAVYPGQWYGLETITLWVLRFFMNTARNCNTVRTLNNNNSNNDNNSKHNTGPNKTVLHV